MTRALVVGRRRKGRDNAEVVADTTGRLRAAGWIVESRVVTRKRKMRKVARRAAKRHVDVVVAVGGDGAVGQVATVLVANRTALGVIPTGTGNLLAGNLGIPTDRRRAIKTLLAGRRRRIDIGQVTVDGTDRVFTVACGIGYDAEVMDATVPAQKLRWGKLAYLANALDQTGSLHRVPHTITIDGVEHPMEASQVVVANFGGRLPILQPRRRIHGDDGRLDVIAIRTDGAFESLLAGWEALTQKDVGQTDDGRVFRAQARRVRIETTPARLVEADGSVVGKTPVEIIVRPLALRVLVPRH